MGLIFVVGEYPTVNRLGAYKCHPAREANREYLRMTHVLHAMARR